MASLNDKINNFIVTDVLTPIAEFLRNRGVNISLQELQECIQAKPVTQPMGIPTGMGMGKIPSSGFGIPPLQQVEGQCSYIINKKDPTKARRCTNKCLDGTPYCSGCWGKDTVRKEASANNIPIPPSIQEKINNKTKNANMGGFGFGQQPYGGFSTQPFGVPQQPFGVPQQPFGVQQPTQQPFGVQQPTQQPFGVQQPTQPFGQGIRPPMLGGVQQTGLPTTTSVPPFIAGQGKVNIPPTAGIQTNTASFVYLNQKLNQLALPNNYDNADQFLVGPNNVVYVDENKGPNVEPTKAVGILDIQSRTVRPLQENEMSLIINNLPYDVSLMPEPKSTTTTQQPSLNPTTSFQASIPIRQPAFPGMNSFQPPQQPITGFPPKPVLTNNLQPLTSFQGASGISLLNNVSNVKPPQQFGVASTTTTTQSSSSSVTETSVDENSQEQ